MKILPDFANIPRYPNAIPTRFGQDNGLLAFP